MTSGRQPEEFARLAHSGQFRKYTGEPYFNHVAEVAAIVERVGLSKEAVAAAWLHDVVEDTGVTFAELHKHFGSEVTSMVWFLTNVPHIAGNRATRTALDRSRIALGTAEVQTIKCADMISNTASIVAHDPGFAKRYLPEKRALLNALSITNSVWHRANQSLVTAESQILTGAS